MSIGRGWRIGLSLVALLPALLPVGTVAAAGAGVADAAPIGTFDCVIEPKTITKLGTPETGIVDAVKVDRGDVVHKGEIVATLDSQLQRLTVQAARLKAGDKLGIRSAQARLSYRTDEAQRQAALHKNAFVSTKKYEEAVAEKRLAQLAVDKAQFDHRMAGQTLAEANERLQRRSIRSPIDGIVAKVTIEPGEYATDQNPLMTIAQIDPLYVKVFVPVSYYGRILIGSPAEVLPQEPIGGVYRARVSVVDQVFDAASGTFGVRLNLPNPKATLPAGLRCKVRFLAGRAAR